MGLAIWRNKLQLDVKHEVAIVRNTGVLLNLEGFGHDQSKGMDRCITRRNDPDVPGGPGGVGAELGQRMAVVVRHVIVDEEIVAEDELPPCSLAQFRVAWQVCRLFAAVALRAVICERDLAAAKHRGIGCQVVLAARGPPPPQTAERGPLR